MSDTNSKRMKTNEQLDSLEERLHNLEEEKEELKEYQEKDREKRCLEYALYERELEEVQKALEEVEDERRGEVHAGNSRRERYAEREKDIQVLSVFPVHDTMLTLLTGS
jgi:structural maintenance of chromosome 3 (chondroitin sulfate proteoglycan 6)